MNINNSNNSGWAYIHSPAISKITFQCNESSRVQKLSQVSEPTKEKTIIEYLKNKFHKLVDWIISSCKKLFGFKNAQLDAPSPVKSNDSIPEQDAPFQNKRTDSQSVPTVPNQSQTGEGQSHKGHDTRDHAEAIPISSSQVQQDNDARLEKNRDLRRRGLLRHNLHKAEKNFYRNMYPNDTDKDRLLNATMFSARAFKAIHEYIQSVDPQANTELVQDAKELVEELTAIQLEASKVQKFSELSEINKNRIVDLLAATLQHPEPLIQDVGLELAQALDLPPETIEALKTVT